MDRGGADNPPSVFFFAVRYKGCVSDEAMTTMSFCEHCAGQRFDRAQVLRTLRAKRKKLRQHGRAGRLDDTLADVIRAVQALEIPHIDFVDEAPGEESVH